MVTKNYTIKSTEERQVAVCITIQKLGMASVDEIINKIKALGSTITEKQANDVIDKLRKQQMISIDLASKNENGQIVKRYCMIN